MNNHHRGNFMTEEHYREIMTNNGFYVDKCLDAYLNENKLMAQMICNYNTIEKGIEYIATIWDIQIENIKYKGRDHYLVTSRLEPINFKDEEEAEFEAKVVEMAKRYKELQEEIKMIKIGEMF